MTRAPQRHTQTLRILAASSSAKLTLNESYVKKGCSSSCAAVARSAGSMIMLACGHVICSSRAAAARLEHFNGVWHGAAAQPHRQRDPLPRLRQPHAAEQLLSSSITAAIPMEEGVAVKDVGLAFWQRAKTLEDVEELVNVGVAGKQRVRRQHLKEQTAKRPHVHRLQR